MGDSKSNHLEKITFCECSLQYRKFKRYVISSACHFNKHRVLGNILPEYGRQYLSLEAPYEWLCLYEISNAVSRECLSLLLFYSREVFSVLTADDHLVLLPVKYMQCTIGYLPNVFNVKKTCHVYKLEENLKSLRAKLESTFAADFEIVTT